MQNLQDMSEGATLIQRANNNESDIRSSDVTMKMNDASPINHEESDNFEARGCCFSLLYIFLNKNVLPNSVLSRLSKNTFPPIF